MPSMFKENYFVSEAETIDEEAFRLVGHTFGAQSAFISEHSIWAPKKPTSGWNRSKAEWSDLFRERVAEPRKLISLSYSSVVERALLETLKSGSLDNDARSYGISVSEAFRNAAKEYCGVSVDPEVMAGAPCIAGTRIPVYMVLDALEYYGTMEGVLKSYPRLTPDQVKDAIGFSKHVVECPIGDETYAVA